MMQKVKKVKNRIYSDYFMKNRFEEYEQMIIDFKNKGFNFAQIKERDTIDDKNKKYVFIRHDIDSEPKVAEKMFEIEQKHGVTSTYYFRQCSLDIELAKKMIASGVEVGYHYEEIADYAKKNNIMSSDEIRLKMDDIKKIFINNTMEFEKKIGCKIETVVSHGDWVNRKLKISNKTIVTSEVKRELNLKFEGYEVEKNLDFRIADRGYPDFWYPNSPKNIIEDDNMKVGLVLIHPRQWCSSPLERLMQDSLRIIEAIRY